LPATTPHQPSTPRAAEQGTEDAADDLPTERGADRSRSALGHRLDGGLPPPAPSAENVAEDAAHRPAGLVASGSRAPLLDGSFGRLLGRLALGAGLQQLEGRFTIDGLIVDAGDDRTAQQ